MSDDTIGGGGVYHYSNSDQANIKVMHTHTVEKSTDDVVLDEIEDASTSNYQEDYIPSASAPTLTPADPQASNEQPNTSPSPQTQYTQNVQTALYNLPSSLLASLANGNSLDGLNKLIYAFNHPNANVDPQVANILNQIKGQALTQTQTALSLGTSWKPDLPNTDAADKQLSSDYNNVFESIVQSSGLSEDDVNSLIFYHYHPEEMSSNDPLAQNLAEFENAAYQSVAESEGLPANTKIPLDSAQYDAQVSKFYDDAFNNHVNEDPETQNLSQQEKAELETLHQFPDADVPDKANLEGFMNQLEQEAQTDTQQQFNLPDQYKPEANFEDFAAQVLGNFKAQWDSNVQNSAPFTLTGQQAEQFQLQSNGQPVTINLTYDQRQLLMQTNGFNTSNLPQQLLPVFQALQNQTAAQIAKSLGLPNDWLSATQKEAPDDDSVVEQALSDAGFNPEDQTNAQGALNNKGINAFAKILGKLLNTDQAADVEFSGTSQSLDSSSALNAINLAQDAVSAIKIRTTQFAALATDSYITAQNGWLNAGDYTELIASCLDKLRQTVYQMQQSSVDTSQKINMMNLEVSKAKQFIQEQQRSAEQQSEQTQGHQKDWAANLKNAAEATHNPWLIALTDTFVGAVKVVSWIINIATGGLISTICQAAGMTDLSENPLEMMGLISADVAAKMDLGLQIVAMVAQMVVEAVLAQPEAIAETVMNLVERVASESAEGVMDIASKAVEGAVQAVKDTVGDMVDAVKSAATSLAEDPKAFLLDLVKSLGTAIKDTGIFKGLSVAGGWIQKAAGEVMEEVSKAIGKLIDAIEDALGIADQAAEDTAKAVQATEEALEGSTTALEDLQNGLRKVRDGLKDIFENPGEHVTEIFKMKEVGMDTLNGSLNAAVAFKNAQTENEQAALKRLIGELDAVLTELDSYSRIINKTAQMILDQLNDLVGWVGDINKQESDMFKKLPVHFVA